MNKSSAFIKEHWFKLGVLILLAVIAYFFYQSTNQATALELQEKCRQAGEKAYELDKELYEDTVVEPKFAYNSKLGKCLYSGGYTNTYSVCQETRLGENCTRGEWERWVKDAYTNDEVIMTWNTFDDSGNGLNSEGDDIMNFWAEHDALMGIE